MSYVVTEDCIRCKYMDCVEVCPVEAFFEGENMLVISPDECIDCGVCEDECPAQAILPEQMAPEWLEHNKKYAAIWPLIVLKGDKPDDADQFLGISGKLKSYFSEAPGTGS